MSAINIDSSINVCRLDVLARQSMTQCIQDHVIEAEVVCFILKVISRWCSESTSIMDQKRKKILKLGLLRLPAIVTSDIVQYILKCLDITPALYQRNCQQKRFVRYYRNFLDKLPSIHVKQWVISST